MDDPTGGERGRCPKAHQFRDTRFDQTWGDNPQEILETRAVDVGLDSPATEERPSGSFDDL
jgi:hypothetical protein